MNDYDPLHWFTFPQINKYLTLRILHNHYNLDYKCVGRKYPQPQVSSLFFAFIIEGWSIIAIK